MAAGKDIYKLRIKAGIFHLKVGEAVEIAHGVLDLLAKRSLMAFVKVYPLWKDYGTIFQLTLKIIQLYTCFRKPTREFES